MVQKNLVMSKTANVLAGLTVLVLSFMPVSGVMLSKSYVFKPGVTLEIGENVNGGLRLDFVKFQVPSKPGVGRTSKVEVAISNTGKRQVKVGIAVALFDEQGNLLGVASGGSALVPLRQNRQKTYSLVFDHVNGSIHKAARFHISVEPK